MTFPKMQIFCHSELSSRVVARGGETTPQAKTCKFPKNVQNAPKLSKFFDFAAGRRLMSTMVSKGCLSQDTEWVGPLLPLPGLRQLPLENFHFGLANVQPCPIMSFHVA